MDTPTGPRGVLIALHGDSDPETAPDWYTSAATDSEIKNYIDLARQTRPLSTRAAYSGP